MWTNENRSAARVLATALIMVFTACAWHFGQAAGEGCALVFPQGTSVDIAEESAIIVWDEASKMQHFIRWAGFAAQAADFGFLVPTPTKPILAEVANDVFPFLEELIKPRIVHQPGGFEITLCALGMLGERAEHTFSDVKSSVRVLHEQRVGGFDAVVLEADDPRALNEWLNRYGYVANPELAPWLAPYVKNNWKITAFKIVHDQKTGKNVTTAPVRMSFTTEKPFFPYREPKSTPGGLDKRLLRVFFVSNHKVAGRLGTELWPGQVAWADRLEGQQGGSLAQHLGFKDNNPITANAWLTTFHDRSAPRAANDDVVFDTAADQTPVRPPPIVRRLAPTVIPVEPIVLVLFVFVLLIRKIIQEHRAQALKSPT